jgi:cytochrome c peroxidase
MGRLQLGREFTPAETKQVVAFLATLTGTQPSFVLPLLPPSSERTPPPQPLE